MTHEPNHEPNYEPPALADINNIRPNDGVSIIYNTQRAGYSTFSSVDGNIYAQDAAGERLATLEGPSDSRHWEPIPETD